MDKSFKWIAFIGLLLVALVASCFMAFEAGQFYQRFYPEQISFIQMGFLAAFLNEIFMAIMAGVWLPQIQFAKLSLVHPANILFKFLLILLFCVSVGGAVFHAIEPRLAVLQKQSNDANLLHLLNNEQQQSEHNMQVFAKQRQRLNAALTAKSQREEQRLRHQVILRHKSTTVLWFEVALMVLLRIVVQMANLCSVWLAGWIYRSQSYDRKRKNKRSVVVNNETTPALADQKQEKALVAEKVEENTKKEIVKDDKLAMPFAHLQTENSNLAKKESSQTWEPAVKEQVSLQVKPKSNVLQPTVKERTDLRVKEQNTTVQEEVKKTARVQVSPVNTTPQPTVKEQNTTLQEEVKKTARVQVSPVNTTSQPEVKEQVKQKQPLDKVLNSRPNMQTLTLASEEKDKLRKMEQYIQGIQKLFLQRSEGVQIADICNSINENEAYVRKIIAARDIRFFDEIQTIYRKLKELREQQLAIG